MEIAIIEEKDNRLVFELKGEGHTFCRMLEKELWNDEHVKAAGYRIKHPLVGIPTFVIETVNEEPKKVVLAAVKRLKKQLSKLKEQVKGIK
ncbi:MAG: DNA-directed RNA polymerase subunit L [Candidatus Woesearchaeota archaeon]